MTNKSQNTNIKKTKRKIYDLEERTFLFSKDVCLLLKTLPKNIVNIEYIRQLTRSSASIGANYIEANESLSKRDFIMRIKICRKEAKESAYWIRLIIETNDKKYYIKAIKLFDESVELKKIFSAILQK